MTELQRADLLRLAGYSIGAMAAYVLVTFGVAVVLGGLL